MSATYEEQKAARETTMAFQAKSRTLERMDTVLYRKIQAKVLAQLQVNHPGLQVKPLLDFNDKKTHGDIDLIVLRPEGLRDDAPLLNGVCPQVIRRKPLTPFYEGMQGIGAYMGFNFQVDITWAQDEHAFEFAQNVYSYSGVGAIAGMIARQMGYHLTHQGLYYKYPGDLSSRGGNKVLMTGQWNLAMAFLDLDLWPKRFRDPAHVFQYFYESRYLDVPRFLASPVTKDQSKCLLEFREWLQKQALHEDQFERIVPFKDSDWEEKCLIQSFPQIHAIDLHLKKALSLIEQVPQ